MPHRLQSFQYEAARLNALRDLRLLDTPPSEAFDRMTRMASRLLAAPVSTISLTDKDRQWFKSRVGVDLTEIPRAQAPCTYAIEGKDVFVVRDMLADERFATSPLAQAGIRFYAGAPLFTRSGYGLGTLCVVDTVPRDLDASEICLLKDLASMVMSQIDLQNMIGRVDPTTGAANQHQFFEDIEDIAVNHPGAPVSAVLVELMSAERATDLNRALGTSPGDEVMRAALGQLQRELGAHARIYHVGPLRCVILADLDQTGDAAALTEKTRAALSQSLLCDGVPITLDPVIGSYQFTAGEVTSRDVLRRLLIAGVEAREFGGGAAAYHSLQEEISVRRFALLNDFGMALQASDQLTLVYQPRIDLKSGQWIGVEALLRWKHPQFGNVPPGEFIPLIEKTALARPLMDWVAAAAVEQQAKWQ
ncbi:MAG: EAL domain-containing protein, partial [Beijerinckiaceae bacterium]